MAQVIKLTDKLPRVMPLSEAAQPLLTSVSNLAASAAKFDAYQLVERDR